MLGDLYSRCRGAGHSRHGQERGPGRCSLVRNVSRLQDSGFERLALLDPLYNFARWLSGDADEAQDLVQETFVKTMKGFGSFQEGTNFRAWMFRILRNTFLTSRTGLERRKTSRRTQCQEGTPSIML
jgi:DNA-directed RNA polymerase specialized sigma24 family protein